MMFGVLRHFQQCFILMSWQSDVFGKGTITSSRRKPRDLP